MELLCEKSGETECVARVLYWDATGQFAFEAFKEIPLDIVEELIVEAKKSVTVGIVPRSPSLQS